MDYKKTGYRFTSGKTIEFVLVPEEYEDKIENDESVFVQGSFNNWLNSADSSWKLSESEDDGKKIYMLRKKVSDISIPGNSGFPEFRFFAISNNSYHTIDQNPQIEGFTMNQNKLILNSDKDCEEVLKLEKLCSQIISLSDFDLECPACRSQITNIRPVPGTKCFYRGYHPFKKSRPEYDTENARISLVQSFYEIYGIKSDITLSGFEGPLTQNGETLPECIKKIEQAQNRLCVNLDYYVVYFHSQASEYAKNISQIAKFIINHKGPYYIHCRLGSDRTGVTCAVFASLCGASWEQIARDYERTSRMGIGEVRSRNLLKYSLTNITGKNPQTTENLQEDMKQYFLRENILSEKEIEELISTLQKNPEKKETDYFDFTENHICKKFRNSVK